jgi:hypothetical protein
LNLRKPRSILNQCDNIVKDVKEVPRAFVREIAFRVMPRLWSMLPKFSDRRKIAEVTRNYFTILNRDRVEKLKLSGCRWFIYAKRVKEEDWRPCMDPELHPLGIRYLPIGTYVTLQSLLWEYCSPGID